MKLTRTHIKRMILESLLNEGMADFKATAGDVDVIRPLLKGAVQDVIADATKGSLAAYTDELGQLNRDIHAAIDTALQNMGDRLSKKKS